jgi:hypothetical protein
MLPKDVSEYSVTQSRVESSRMPGSVYMSKTKYDYGWLYVFVALMSVGPSLIQLPWPNLALAFPFLYPSNLL